MIISIIFRFTSTLLHAYGMNNIIIDVNISAVEEQVSQTEDQLYNENDRIATKYAYNN